MPPLPEGSEGKNQSDSSSLPDLLGIHGTRTRFILVDIEQLIQLTLPGTQRGQPVLIFEWTHQFTLDVFQSLAFFAQRLNVLIERFGNTVLAGEQGSDNGRTLLVILRVVGEVP